MQRVVAESDRMKDQRLAWSTLGEHFADPDKAREYLEHSRWGETGLLCAHCDGAGPYELKARAGSSRPGRKGLYKCRRKECRRQFTVTVGTIFEDSHVPLHKWLQAIYLIGTSPGVRSAHQLHQLTAVTYRSASFMLHRLRHATDVDPAIRQRAPWNLPKRPSAGNPLGFDEIVRLLLQTPPLAPEARGSRKTTDQERWRMLRRAFDEAHQAGIAGLKTGDHAGLARAIARERAIIRKQVFLIAETQRRFRKLRMARHEAAAKKR